MKEKPKRRRLSPKFTCEHYREIMSECRNCDPSDAPYKICFCKKVAKKETHRGSKYPAEE